MASHYYVKAPSIVTFNEKLRPHLTEGDVLAMMALSSEFDSMAVRCVCVHCVCFCVCVCVLGV